MLEPTAALFRGLLEAAPDAMVIVRPDGRIALVNAQTEQFFGYAREEILGQPVEILVPDRFHHVHSSQRVGYFAHPRPRPMGLGLELFARRKDGSEFPVEISLSPMETMDGSLVIAAIRDITERRRMEAALRASRELSTPVLPIRERLLILPIIGVLDTERAAQLTERLLQGIRAHRARVAVMDITGVPTIDATVANHLLQTVHKARLLGATVIATGVSSAIARTLVATGVDLRGMLTVVDLQAGVEEAERLIGYKLVMTDEPGSPSAEMPGPSGHAPR
jgi:rsbT co-antagonist protein RsbR